MYLLKDVPQRSIGEVTEGIQVVAHGATEENRVLGDDGHIPPEVMQPNLFYVYPIDGDGSKRLSHPVEHRQQRGFPGTCATHNANLRRSEKEMWQVWFEHRNIVQWRGLSHNELVPSLRV